MLPYSRIGLTLDLKRSAKISLSMNLNVRLIIPITWLAFFSVVDVLAEGQSVVYGDSFVFLSRRILESVVWSSLVFIVYVCSRCRCPILMILNLSG